MDLFEQIHDICKPESEKPIIQKIIDKSKRQEFDYNAEAIECHADDRLFIFPIHDHELKIEWLYDQENLNPNDEDDYDRAEIDLISQDKDFLQRLFLKNYKHIEEL